MAPNLIRKGSGGRQSMMSVPSLVLIPADNPNDIKVLCSGKKRINLLPDYVKMVAPVPEIKVIPPSPRVNAKRKRWDSNVQMPISNETFEENEVFDWSVEGSDLVQTKGSSKSHSNTFVNNKNVTPFIIRRSPLKEVPISKTEDIAPTQNNVINHIRGKLNFTQISMSDDSEHSINTPISPMSDDCENSIITPTSELKQVFFTPKEVLANEVSDDVFDDVILSSPPDTGANDKVHNAVNGSKVDATNSVKQEDKIYSVSGEDWPPAEKTPQQEQESFKIFCDQEFRECGGITPVIGNLATNPLSEGSTKTLPEVTAHNSLTGDTFHSPLSGETVHNSPTYQIAETGTSQKICSKNQTKGSSSSYVTPSGQGNQHRNLVNQPNNTSYVTPPTQTWHSLVLEKKDPTPSPSQLYMKVQSDKAAPLWATPSVLKQPHTKVVVCNPDLETCSDYGLEHPSPNRDIQATDQAISLWSTPTILKTDASQQVVLRTPAVQGGVYSSVPRGSHYSSLTRRRNSAKVQAKQMEKQEAETEEKKSPASISYVEVITNIFKGIFGGLNKGLFPDNFAVNDLFYTVDIPVIYPHYEVANGVHTVETEKKNE